MDCLEGWETGFFSIWAVMEAEMFIRNSLCYQRQVYDNDLSSSHVISKTITIFSSV